MELSSLAVEAVPDGQRLADWHEDRGIPRTNAYGLLKLLGIKPDSRKVPGARKPVAWLSAEQIAALDPLAERLRDGATLSRLEAELSGTVRDRSAGDALATVPNDAGLSGMVPNGPGLSGMEALAQLAAALSPASAPDPLAVPRRLAEAADLGVWLTTPELAAVVGMAPGTVRGWSDGHSPRPGFVLERRKDGGSVWWRVAAGTD